MTFVVKDANTTAQNVATEATTAGELAFVRVTAFDVAGVATLVNSTTPLPVAPLNSLAVSGDTVISSATVAQTLFSNATPAHGFQISNNTAQALFASDVGPAGAGVGMQIAANTIYTTPDGYKPAGPVSIYGGVTAGNVAARRW